MQEFVFHILNDDWEIVPTRLPVDPTCSHALSEALRTKENIAACFVQNGRHEVYIVNGDSVFPVQ